MRPAPRILAAEPSPLYRGMLLQAAEMEMGAVVVFAYGLEELLELVRHADFDMTVIDYGYLGNEAARCIREIARELPKAAVLVTMQPSKANGAVQKEISEAGGARCFVKPIYGSYDENLGEIRQLLADMLSPILAEGYGKAHRLVLMAASTGGQQALEALLPEIAGDFPAPILIALHIPTFATESVAASLDKKAALRVKVAQDREHVEAGTVYLAAGGLHMTLSAKRQTLLVDSPPVNGVKPSADVLFESAAKSGAWSEVLAVILTGMGKDSAKGLAALKARLNCQCIAQSERTCTVYGMPKAAVESGLADRILDLGDIARGVETFGFSPLPQGRRRL